MILTQEQLEKLSTKRLLSVLRMATAWKSSILYYYGRRCCELCHEYIGDDWERDVGRFYEPVKRYHEQIKVILATREHVERRGRRKQRR